MRETCCCSPLRAYLCAVAFVTVLMVVAGCGGSSEAGTTTVTVAEADPADTGEPRECDSDLCSSIDVCVELWNRGNSEIGIPAAAAPSSPWTQGGAEFRVGVSPDTGWCAVVILGANDQGQFLYPGHSSGISKSQTIILGRSWGDTPSRMVDAVTVSADADGRLRLP